MATSSAKAARRRTSKSNRTNSKLILTALVLAALCMAAPLFTGTVTAQAVTWVNGVNVTITGNSVEKTGGVNYTWDASAVSQQQIQDNDGADWYAEFTAPQTGASFFTVSCQTQGASYAELQIQFGYNGNFTIYESAQNRYAGTHAAGDVFRIARVSGTIKYLKNGTVIHTSIAAPSYPLIYRFDAREMNSKITSATVVNNAPAPLGTAKNLTTSVVTSSRIDLSWTDMATAETGFKIERRAGEPGTWAQIGTTSANVTTYSDTDTALARNIPYSYRVRPTDGTSDGGYSKLAHATIQPAVLGSIKTDRAIYPEGALPVKPLSGAYIYDPVFGTRLMRVTDIYDGSASGGTAYSYWPTFNLNNTRILAHLSHPTGSTAPSAAIYDFDPVNFKLGARRFPRPLPGGGYPIFQWAIWSNITADLLYAVDYFGKLWSYNVGSDEWALVANFATSVNNPLPAGHYGWQMQMSADDDVFSLTESENTNWTQVGYFVYKKSTNTITKRVIDANINEVHIDKSGRYLFGITLNESSYDGDGVINGFVWDLQTGTPRDNLTDSTPDMSPGHFDMGHGTIVGNANWGAGTMTKRNLATPHTFTTVLGPVAPETYGQPMDHLSMLATNEEWVFGSNFHDTSIARVGGKELFQIKLDGSQSLRRLAHHYALWDDSLCNDAGNWDCDYYGSTRANISKDGRFAAFSSNWNVLRGRNDLYIAQFEAAPSSTSSGPQAVVWTDLVKATTSAGGGIVKTPDSGEWPNASAKSTQTINGDGYFECYLNHNGAPNLYPINVGLNSGDTANLEYYWAISSGHAQPYVNNSYKASTLVTTGDKLKISVESGVVKFYKNAELVYTSDVAPAFPLDVRFGSSLYNAGLTSAAISNSGSVAATWTDLVKATTSAGGGIVKTPDSGEWPNASANSVQSLSGNGSFECIVNHNGAPNLYPINVGLNSASTSAGDYYWAISSGHAQPYVNDSYRASTTVTTNDRLKIAIEAGVVKFYKNADLIYTSDVAPVYPLKGYFGSSMYNVGLTSASFTGAN
jgi:hypothetical protein